MKIKDGFIVREVAGQIVVLPSGDDLDLNVMITLNSTGKFLWEILQKGAQKEDLVSAILANYDADEATAESAVDAFISELEKNGFLE